MYTCTVRERGDSLSEESGGGVCVSRESVCVCVRERRRRSAEEEEDDSWCEND